MRESKPDAVARLVREKIADGTLKPGGPAPTAAALARETGFAKLTCRTGLRILLAGGTLTRGNGPAARHRVAPPAGSAALDAVALRDRLSQTLAARRHDRGLTQPELGKLIGASRTTVGHAETGHVWQSRKFWGHADAVLIAGGELLRLYDAYQIATHAPPPGPVPSAEPVPATVLLAGIARTPDGVLVTWPDGTETLVRPPDHQDPETSGAGPPPPSPVPEQYPHRKGVHREPRPLG